LNNPLPLGIDHLVLVTRNVPQTLSFYERVFGAVVQNLDAWQQQQVSYPVLHMGTWKINVHPLTTEAAPRARLPEPGSVDLCLVWPGPITDAIAYLDSQAVPIELGPVTQEGALGWGHSIYFRDPDGNLLEFLSYEVPDEEN
jgi:catechol 2,3-dioxygenase-like lactoylglutathione lyase family enzyme